MSVIITGMNVPKGCTKCPCIETGYEYSHDDTPVSVCHLLNDEQIDGFTTDERFFDCPLKSIEGLIEKIEHLGIHKSKFISSEGKVCVDVKEVLAIIKEYCEAKENE